MRESADEFEARWWSRKEMHFRFCGQLVRNSLPLAPGQDERNVRQLDTVTRTKREMRQEHK